MRFTKAAFSFGLTALACGCAVMHDRKEAAPLLEVSEPAKRVIAQMGKPIRIRWRLRVPPANPEHWELEVFVEVCAINATRIPIYSAPLDEARSEIEWIPTSHSLEYLECDSEEDCEPVPIVVELIDIEKANDEDRLMHATCKAASTSGWLVSASAAGRIDLGAAVAKARKESQ
jgi:hypothetical protein